MKKKRLKPVAKPVVPVPPKPKLRFLASVTAVTDGVDSTALLVTGWSSDAEGKLVLVLMQKAIQQAWDGLQPADGGGS